MRPSWHPPGRTERGRGGRGMRPLWPPTRGRGGRGNRGRGGHILDQLGNKKLIDASSSSRDIKGLNTNYLMYEEFMNFMKSKQSKDNNHPTYSSILVDEENTEVYDMNDPWQLMSGRRTK
ncbi:hypothetical protein RDI58_022019 [Solanum bulbocastanum]|uniref:Uncharacterized protein n=1 Tax=Solanum bulbocastanum TaxID=147425 RepID=A0AAN8T3C8_SOLBU